MPNEITTYNYDIDGDGNKDALTVHVKREFDDIKLSYTAELSAKGSVSQETLEKEYGFTTKFGAFYTPLIEFTADRSLFDQFDGVPDKNTLEVFTNYEATELSLGHTTTVDMKSKSGKIFVDLILERYKNELFNIPINEQMLLDKDFGYQINGYAVEHYSHSMISNLNTDYSAHDLHIYTQEQ